MLLSDYPDYYEEITLGEFQAINKALQKERKKIDYSKGIVPADGHVPYDDIDKYYLYCQPKNKYIAATILFNPMNDADTDIFKFTEEDMISKYEDMKRVISSGGEVQPVQAYYNSALDIYLCSDGWNRSRVFYDLKKDIPYEETPPGVKLIATETFVSNYRDEVELIEMGELDATTITSSQYKALLILRNNWRKDLI